MIAPFSVKTALFFILTRPSSIPISIRLSSFAFVTFHLLILSAQQQITAFSHIAPTLVTFHTYFLCGSVFTISLSKSETPI